jgi:hypothetical protein
LARVPRFNAIEGVQEGAEKPLTGQRIDGATATFGTDLLLTSDLAIMRKSKNAAAVMQGACH